MKLVKRLYNYLGWLYIPKELRHESFRGLLHLTDTPNSLQNNINRLIQTLNPEIIIHTGDLVDNLKLEMKPYLKELYHARVKKLINILESSNASEIYIVCGNHDAIDLIKRYAKRSIIIENTYDLIINGKWIQLSHYPMNTGNKMNLFGHSLDVLTIPHECYNGLEYIYYFNMQTWKCYTIDYPASVQEERQNKYKFGI